MNDSLVAALAPLVPGGVARGELKVDGRALRWIEAGSGWPTVVLEAGYSDSAVAWAPILPGLAGRTRVVAYDRAGLGASDPAPWLPTVDRQVTDLATVVRQAARGPCIAVGHSWGGILVEVLACRHPDLVAGLVLVDPAHEDMTASLPPWASGLVELVNLGILAPLPSWLHALRLIGAVEWRSGLHRARSIVDPEVRSLLAEAHVRSRATRSQVAAIRAESRGIAASVPLIRQSRIDCGLPRVPMVVLSATRGAPRGVRKHWTALQADLAAAAPQGRHMVVPGAGHGIQHDRPDCVLEVLLELVEEARREV